MTPTSLCITMNKIYDGLKQMSLEELDRMLDYINVYGGTPRKKVLMEYQVRETIRRKLVGIW